MMAVIIVPLPRAAVVAAEAAQDKSLVGAAVQMVVSLGEDTAMDDLVVVEAAAVSQVDVVTGNRRSPYVTPKTIILEMIMAMNTILQITMVLE